MKIFFIFKHIIYQWVLMTIIDKNAVVAFTSSELKTILENDNGHDMVYEDNIKSIKLLERNGFDKIHKSWFYQDVLYRKMLNK